MCQEFDRKGTIDGGLSWLVVAASFMTQFIVIGVYNVFGLLYTELLTDFNESRAAIGKTEFVSSNTRTCKN